MRVLLDECLPIDFRHGLLPHEVNTAEWAGLKGKKNGELLRVAEAAGYEVFVTVDHGIPHQQSPAARRIAIVVIPSHTNKLEDLASFTDALLLTLQNIETGQVIVLPRKEPNK